MFAEGAAQDGFGVVDPVWLRPVEGLAECVEASSRSGVVVAPMGVVVVVVVVIIIVVVELIGFVFE